MVCIDQPSGQLRQPHAQEDAGLPPAADVWVGLPELMVCLNYSSQRQTLDYLCVQPGELGSVYLNKL
jgi:hypothetical protein